MALFHRRKTGIAIAFTLKDCPAPAFGSKILAKYDCFYDYKFIFCSYSLAAACFLLNVGELVSLRPYLVPALCRCAWYCSSYLYIGCGGFFLEDEYLFLIYSCLSGKMEAEDVMGKKRLFPPLDSEGNAYKYPRAENVSEKEHAKICHEINSLYFVKYQGRKTGYHVSYSNMADSPAYAYRFEIHGFNEYNIFHKSIDE